MLITNRTIATAHPPSLPPPLMAHASIPRVAVQSRWTFVHFAIAPRGKRCQSAPPEVHVMRGLTAAKRRERRHAARSRTNGGEKWMALAQKLSARHRQTAIALMGRVPRRRITLPAALYKQLEQCVLDRVSSSALKCGGAVRDDGDTVEIWSTTLAAREHPMKCLIHQAARCKRAWEIGAYQVLADGECPLVLACDDETTADDLVLMVAFHFGIPRHRFTLIHMGWPLARTDKLREQGVGPGSCVLLIRQQ